MGNDDSSVEVQELSDNEDGTTLVQGRVRVQDKKEFNENCPAGMNYQDVVGALIRLYNKLHPTKRKTLLAAVDDDEVWSDFCREVDRVVMRRMEDLFSVLRSQVRAEDQKSARRPAAKPGPAKGRKESDRSSGTGRKAGAQ